MLTAGYAGIHGFMPILYELRKGFFLSSSEFQIRFYGVGKCSGHNAFLPKRKALKVHNITKWVFGFEKILTGSG